MKTWAVTIPMAGHAYLEVEAETEEDAFEQAMLNVSLDHVEGIEALMRVNSGNVCHFPSPWDAEARLISDDEISGDTSEPLGDVSPEEASE